MVGLGVNGRGPVDEFAAINLELQDASSQRIARLAALEEKLPDPGATVVQMLERVRLARTRDVLERIQALHDLCQRLERELAVVDSVDGILATLERLAGAAFALTEAR